MKAEDRFFVRNGCKKNAAGVACGVFMNYLREDYGIAARAASAVIKPEPVASAPQVTSSGEPDGP
jgi:hypothetical protein